MTDAFDQETVSKIVGEIIEDMGIRLYEIQFNHVTQTLRVFIDRESSGVTIADCKNVSKLIRNALEKTELIWSSYSLEVSSPGVERPLKQPQHFRWAVGKVVELDADDQKIKGYLRDIRSNGIVIATESGERFVAFSAIAKAKVVEDLVYGK